VAYSPTTKNVNKFDAETIIEYATAVIMSGLPQTHSRQKLEGSQLRNDAFANVRASRRQSSKEFCRRVAHE
jgi:hypothetical protein